MLRTRPVSQACEESKQMARRKIEYLRPYKPRPQTSSLVASKLIGASLGMRNIMTKDKVEQEKNKLKEAKGRTEKKISFQVIKRNLNQCYFIFAEKRRNEKDLKESAWNGDI